MRFLVAKAWWILSDGETEAIGIAIQPDAKQSLRGSAGRTLLPKFISRTRPIRSVSRCDRMSQPFLVRIGQAKCNSKLVADDGWPHAVRSIALQTFDQEVGDYVWVGFQIFDAVNIGKVRIKCDAIIRNGRPLFGLRRGTNDKRIRSDVEHFDSDIVIGGIKTNQQITEPTDFLDHRRQ